MKYQIKGSTVTFTNRSVNVADVTSWKWWLDENGGGFTEITGIPSPDVSADITFPNTAGVLCTVRLTASGPWGSDVVYDEQYTTVENIAAPVGITKNLSAYRTLDYVDELMEIEPGTGAGDLTWEMVSTETYGLSIDLITGRITGHVLLNGAGSLAAKVTDALGRSAFVDITLSVNADGLVWASTFQNNNKIIKDVDNKVSSVTSDIVGITTSALQATSTRQPTLANDGMYNYLDWPVAVNSQGIGTFPANRFIAVLAPTSEIRSGSLILSNTTNTVALNNVHHMDYGFRVGATKQIPWPNDSQKIILSSIRSQANYMRTNAIFVDGLFRNLEGGYSYYLGGIGGSAQFALAAARVRCYGIIWLSSAVGSVMTVDRLNNMQKWLSTTFNIPCKRFDAAQLLPDGYAL